MTEPEDYVASIVGHFCELTGKLICAPADYQVATDWEAQGIPRQMVLSALDKWSEANHGKKWLRHAQLAWIASRINEDLTNWKRAVGPSYRSL